MSRRRCLRLAPVLLVLSAAPALSQDEAIVQQLRAAPGYDRYEAMRWQIPAAVTSGEMEADWSDDSTSFDFTLRGQRWRFDMARLSASGLAEERAPAAGRARPWRGPGGGATDWLAAMSPDGRFNAVSAGGRLTVHDRRTASSFSIGGELAANGVTFGAAPAIYAELGQRAGMWWSPDSRRLAFLRVETRAARKRLRMDDEQVDAGNMETTADGAGGAHDSIVDILVYDVQTNASATLDIRPAGTDAADASGGRNPPGVGDGPGFYVHRIDWSPGGDVWLRRLNRRQNHMELAACAPSTGACRTVLVERWPSGWVSDAGELRWLADGKRFIWKSERTGFANLYLYSADGALLSTLTRHGFAVEDVVAIDEPAGTVFYTARDGDNLMKLQLHRVGLDGAGDVRLSDPAFHHTVRLSPDRRYFVDVLETHAMPPVTRVADARTGTVMAEISRTDLTRFTRLGLRTIELFRYLAADGATELFGSIQYPSNFDPARTYPVLIPLYNAPESSAGRVSERFTLPQPATELGFLIVTLDTRSTPGRGRQPLDAIHRHLGQADIDDLAQGIRALGRQSFVDRRRIGVYGTSYGGYAATMLMLREPDLVAAAVVSSPVTMWEHYNPVYTERYMGVLADNPDGYRRGSAITYAGQLRGRLLLFYGTADRNVLPLHSRSLIRAFDAAGKRIEIEIGSGQDHVSIGYGRLLVFFVEHLGGPGSPTSSPPS